MSQQDVKMNTIFKMTLITIIVYIVIAVTTGVLCTQVVSYNEEYTDCVYENLYNYTKTNKGYYEPLKEVIEQNTKMLSGKALRQNPKSLLPYLDGEGNEEECKQVWQTIMARADEICKDVRADGGYSYDYMCVRELAKYVAYNTYYDWDAFNNHVGLDTINLKEVMRSKRATCAGFSNYFAALCEARGYETVSFRGGVVSDIAGISYADLGNSPTNHEWVGVYIDNRLVLVDVTWIATNFYRDGVYHTGKRLRYAYFDIDFDTFCVEHRIDIMEERNFGEMIDENNTENSC